MNKSIDRVAPLEVNARPLHLRGGALPSHPHLRGKRVAS